MAQPQKQPVLAAYLLTVLVMLVMLVAAMVVTTRHAGVMPALLHVGMVDHAPETGPPVVGPVAA